MSELDENFGSRLELFNYLDVSSYTEAIEKIQELEEREPDIDVSEIRNAVDHAYSEIDSIESAEISQLMDYITDARSAVGDIYHYVEQLEEQ